MYRRSLECLERWKQESPQLRKFIDVSLASQLLNHLFIYMYSSVCACASVCSIGRACYSVCEYEGSTQSQR